MKTKFSIYSLLLIVFGCAVLTVIPPSVVLLSVDSAKNKVTELMISKGYDLRKTEPLVFEKEADFSHKVLYGTKYDREPKFRVTFVFLPIDSSTKIIINSEIISNPNSAFERVEKITTNKDIKIIVEELEKLTQ